MNKDKFIILIESIGFTQEKAIKFLGSIHCYKYEEYKIFTYNNCYTIHIGSNWMDYIPYTDLSCLKKLIRVNRLKQLLG